MPLPLLIFETGVKTSTMLLLLLMQECVSVWFVRVHSTVELLLQRGASPNASSCPMPALFFAVRSGDADMVQQLLLKGAEPGVTLPDSVSALDHVQNLVVNIGAIFTWLDITQHNTLSVGLGRFVVHKSCPRRTCRSVSKPVVSS